MAKGKAWWSDEPGHEAGAGGHRRRPNLIWHLRAILLASIVGPLLVLSYTGWSNYRIAGEHASERLQRALDILQEHALKTLQGVELTISETNEILRGRSDAEIRADEEALAGRIRELQVLVPQEESIWAFDKTGAPLLSSTVFPVPRNLNNADRDYFQAHAGREAGTYIGSVIAARVGTMRFFVVSRRRPGGPGDAFNGVIGATVLPEQFLTFYGRLAPSVASTLALLRSDGSVLARYPRTDEIRRLSSQSDVMRMIAARPETGIVTARSELDGDERRISYRRLPGYPLYVVAGVDTSVIAQEAWSATRGEVAFGIPATLAMIALAYHALRRTERQQAESVRREQAEVALKQAQRLEALGRLTGGVAHDFNNLLMVVSGNVERLRGPMPEDRRKRALDAIETATKRGASLTRQLLSFSRRQTHEPVAIDLPQHLDELKEMLQSSLRGNINVELRTHQELWPIKVDPSEFELALLNIAVNARDAMPNGGTVAIAAQNATLHDDSTIGATGEFVALSVTDTGTGIPPEVLTRVFEPFFTTKGVGKGTGLGLSQVYGFARQSGGAATIASRPGDGTSVTLYLPRTLERPQEPAPLPEPAPGPRAERGRVLLVEDNPDVAEITRARLEQLGYQVTHATNVEAARAQLAELANTLDLVLTDIVMPGDANGLDLARHIRTQQGPQLPVLLATGYSDVAQRAAEEGFIVLRKPYEMRQLQEALARAMRTRLKVVV